jgi:hypothetical protein
VSPDNIKKNIQEEIERTEELKRETEDFCGIIKGYLKKTV